MSELSDAAKEYADKMFPCEGETCGSWQACSGCCDRACFEAGYEFGLKAHAPETEDKTK